MIHFKSNIFYHSFILFILTNTTAETSSNAMSLETNFFLFDLTLTAFKSLWRRKNLPGCQSCGHYSSWHKLLTPTKGTCIYIEGLCPYPCRSQTCNPSPRFRGLWVRAGQPYDGMHGNTISERHISTCVFILWFRKLVFLLTQPVGSYPWRSLWSVRGRLL